MCVKAEHEPSSGPVRWLVTPITARFIEKSQPGATDLELLPSNRLWMPSHDCACLQRLKRIAAAALPGWSSRTCGLAAPSGGGARNSEQRLSLFTPQMNSFHLDSRVFVDRRGERTSIKFTQTVPIGRHRRRLYLLHSTRCLLFRGPNTMRNPPYTVGGNTVLQVFDEQFKAAKRTARHLH